jgi:hypothetical protein
MLPNHRIQGGRAGTPAGQASSVIQKNTSVRAMSRISPDSTIVSRFHIFIRIFIILLDGQTGSLVAGRLAFLPQRRRILAGISGFFPTPEMGLTDRRNRRSP